MADMKCPACGSGEFQEEVRPAYSAVLGGVRFPVPNARFLVCRSCGEEVVTAEELKRWRDLKHDFESRNGLTPDPKRVRVLRERLGMSVGDFAALFAVTRQTVHGWERAGGGPRQSPASLLLSLLEQDVAGARPSILAGLLDAARQRGQTPRVVQTGMARHPGCRFIRDLPDAFPRFTRQVA